MLSQIDLVIECRDYRIPITSRNPMFEQSLAGKDKIVVYTKRDLVSSTSEEERKVSHDVYKRMIEVLEKLD